MRVGTGGGSRGLCSTGFCSIGRGGASGGAARAPEAAVLLSHDSSAARSKACVQGSRFLLPLLADALVMTRLYSDNSL